MKRRGIAPTIIFLYFFLFPTAHAAIFSRTQILMGDVPVTISIKAPFSQKREAFEGMEKAYAEAKRIEEKVSEFQPESDTSCLNKNSGKKRCSLGDDLLILLKISDSFSKLTEGAFDVTFASPNHTASYRDIQINEKQKKAFLRKTKMKIGVSASAKGYILDQMAVMLKLAGFRRFVVNAGGDLLAEGSWKIRIRGSHTSLHLKNQTAMSSGLLERGHHIIDPRTRSPVHPDYLSVTVMAPTGIIGDPLAVAAFVAGPEKTKKFIAHLPQAEVLFLYQDRVLTLRKENSIQR